MNTLVERILRWFAPEAPAPMPPSGVRINVPRSILHGLRCATVPSPLRHEPLAFLRVRYASEDVRDVLVAVGIIPFANTAYVEGDAGANFDTRWVVDVANREVLTNAGLMLVHSHGGRGRPIFSSVDRTTNATVMTPLSIGVPVVPYGAMVLSDEDATAVVATAGRLADAQVVIVPDLPGRMDLSA
jgi:hypothetical protein